MVLIMDNIAVVGLGSISKRHRSNIRRLYPNATIYAVSSSGRQEVGNLDNVDKYLPNVDELLHHNIDMVVVASPATFHANHAIPLIKAGIPVLIEKPLSASYIDAEVIAKAAEQTNTPVAVGYCLRYLSSSQKIKEIVDSKILGTVYNVFVEIGQYLPGWRPDEDYRNTVSANKDLGGGALLELSHEFDYLQWLFGKLSPHSAILRSSHELGLEVEDSADILAYDQNNTVYSIHLDFLQRTPHRECRIVGSNGSIRWDLIANQVWYDVGNARKLIFDDGESERNQMYLSMLKDFERKINNEQNNCITVSEAQQTISFIEEAKKLASTRLYS